MRPGTVHAEGSPGNTQLVGFLPGANKISGKLLISCHLLSDYT